MGSYSGKIDTDGESIYVQVVLGNVFIGVQPTFGFEGDPVIASRKGHAPTHSFYNFINRTEITKQTFYYVKTMELWSCWENKLDCPKSVGRSLINVFYYYLYASNNPSEGALAKKNRSNVNRL